MYKISIVKVVDGDTYQAKVNLEVKEPLMGIYTNTSLERSIVLDTVDTPELKEPAGRKVRSVVELILDGAQEVHFEPTKKPDSFGRLVGKVYITDSGGTYDLGESLVDSGLALIYGWADWDEEALTKAEESCDNLFPILLPGRTN